MELALSLGDTPTNNNKPFGFLSKPSKLSSSSSASPFMALGFCVGLARDSASASASGSGSGSASIHDDQGREVREEDDDEEEDEEDDDDERIILPGSGSGSDPPVQLDLLPPAPVPRSHHSSSSHLPFPWLSDHYGGAERVLDVNRLPAVGPAEETDDRAAAAAAGMSSPNSAVSSFQMDFGVRNGGGSKRSSDFEMETERASSRISDDDENGSARKKLRLSKEQSAFLEESFKEHSTLNPKQKLALAKQLNLRPRQVEVWFQNRRARTKLKQTEVDCEYLRRCCETLTEENRRLQKELQELRALKTSQPFYMQLPATTLTMCPSCERVATTAPAPVAKTTSATATNPSALCLANKPRILPFPHLHQAAS
ncbi:homeobox-leucine zipper protein HOX11 isoform X2 [Momordica charantia]|uniref:Homeobox-leucine zipper protein HOX11 isoform X2 n=1 Tax=Momordica charantia TaxID=3673 RepID=A0A6J1DDA9_MOMCH|nr:homeobox-leucine zipper protein HOX11 isoform X2 [Momordica charantia]